MIQLISYKMHNPSPFSPGLGTDDGAGGMKIFCIYMYNMRKKNTFSSANVGLSQARVKKE
jgi:hypothetical protein